MFVKEKKPWRQVLEKEEVYSRENLLFLLDITPVTMIEGNENKKIF